MQSTPFECNICYTIVKPNTRNKQITCIGCEYTVCSNCQKTYAKTECMNCHSLFKTAYAIEKMGVVFVSQTAKRTKLTELMTQQKRELETVGPLVEWTKTCQQIQRALRYGVHVRHGETGDKLPPKPSRHIHATSCPCPINDCRGHVTEGACTICKVAVCGECLCVIRIEDSHHTCDPSVIETLKEIRENSKPCPKCSVYIHKTEGCDHMHCTHCNTHFSYNSLTILLNSSNHHYQNRLIGRRQNMVQEVGNDVCAVSMENDRIPFSVLEEYMSSTCSSTMTDVLIDALYNTTKVVRNMKKTEYNEIDIARRSRDRYDDLQIKYVLGEITEKRWETMVYQNHVKQQSAELIAGILHIFLANMDGFQSELYGQLTDGPVDDDRVQDLITRVDTLIDIVNTNLQDIHDDYDPTTTSILRIRKVGAKDVGYCVKHNVNNSKKIPKDQDGVAQNTLIVEREPVRQIQLYPYQVEHVVKLESFLENHHYAIDLSPLGTGKTYTAAKMFGQGLRPSLDQACGQGLRPSLDQACGQGPKYRHLVTISPPSVKTKWLEVNKNYSLGCRENLTYGEVTGRRFATPKCGFLIRNDYTVPVEQENGFIRMIDKYNYETTTLFKDLVREGLLLVVDEFQHLKNDCAQTEACETLIAEIYNNFQEGGTSRVLLLSGSPIDKEEQAVRLFKTLGIMTHPKIVSGFQEAGINQIVKYVNQRFCDVAVNPRHTSEHYQGYGSARRSHTNQFIRDTIRNIIRYDYSSGTLRYFQDSYRSTQYAYQIFLNVIKPNVSSSMDLTHMQASNVVLRKYNGYFNLNEARHREKIAEAIEQLSNIQHMRASLQASRDTNAESAPGQGSQIMSMIVRALTSIEMAKVETFARLAKTALRENPRKKVVIGVNYTASIADLVEMLGEYDPLVIQGSTAIKGRMSILERFQAPDDRHRLLIGNISVISTGIDLDDKSGEFPRVCYVSPNYNTIHIYQLGHRFLRGLDTRSDTDIYMVYSNNRVERRMIEALMHKGTVMKNVTIEQAEAGIVFPCDYETWDEVE